MIRKMHKDEIEVVSNIWLNGNLTAHNFIDKNYWLKALATVKEQFQLKNNFNRLMFMYLLIIM